MIGPLFTHAAYAESVLALLASELLGYADTLLVSFR